MTFPIFEHIAKERGILAAMEEAAKCHIMWFQIETWRLRLQ